MHHVARQEAVPALGLRAQKKLRTRADLEAAGLRLFAERGFDAVTVDDIAAAAGVAARTFFRHFASKDDILISYYRDYIDRLRVCFAERPPDEHPLVSVRHAMLTLAADYENEKEAAFLRARLMTGTPSLLGRSFEVQQQWEAVIEAEVAARLGIERGTDLRPALVAACAVSAMRVAANAWIASGGERNLPELLDASLLLIAGGGDAGIWTSGAGLGLVPEAARAG